MTEDAIASTAEESRVLRRLRSIRGERAQFERLSRAVICESLGGFLPKSGRVAEIGTGDGQLRDWLPEDMLDRLVHTEPLGLAVSDYRKAHPEVLVLQASAEKLPFGDGELAAVIGSCVLDVVEDGVPVARELARVLRPGGVLLHWLDLSTRLNPIFAQLAPSTLVPIPNVFSDPSAARWPEDLFLVPRAELEIVLEVLARHHHPLAPPLGQYLALFTTVPFPLEAAIAEFVRLLESAELRAALHSIFRDALELADAELRPRLADFRGRPVASSRHFESRLKRWFSPESGFDVEHSEIALAWELAPRDSESLFSYVSSSVGEQRQLPAPPETLLCSDANLPDETHLLRELGIFVFVARRR